MKKAAKKATAVLMAIVLAVLAVVPAFASTMEEPQTRTEDGVEFVAFRQAADDIGVTVEWDGANQTVIVTDPSGNVRYVVVYDVGGFNDNGTVWVPADFAAGFFYITGDDESVYVEVAPIVAPEAEPADMSWLLEREPVVRTTDHGELAVAIITEVNDNLYNRVPFSYRELEAAEWIAYELVAMGFDEDAVVIQSFYMGDVEEFMLGFGFDWFIEAVRRRANDEELAPEAFIEARAEAIYQQAIADFAEMGISYEMIAGAIGGDLVEIIETQIMPSLGFMFDMYGIFNDTVEFRPYSQNVILTIPGQSEQKIVLTAHFDTVYNVPGASDNASGVALLMESAYSMLGADNYYTLVYVFAGAEEVGLVGTYYYYLNLTAAQQANILFNINADVLFEGPYFFFGAAQLDANLVGLPQHEIMSYVMDGYGFIENDVTRLATQIAEAVNEQYGAQLLDHRDLAFMPSDQLVFLFSGHTVVTLIGLARYEDTAYAGFNFNVSQMTLYEGIVFGGSIVHTPYDNVHFINESWPDKIANAMWTFSLFLDALLAAKL